MPRCWWRGEWRCWQGRAQLVTRGDETEYLDANAARRGARPQRCRLRFSHDPKMLLPTPVGGPSLVRIPKYGYRTRHSYARCRMNKSRLEAFSDGVLAVIITIMVLEMKSPRGASIQALRPVIPVFLSYILSYVNVGIYWSNHHHLLHATERVNGATLWANLHLLFWLSWFRSRPHGWTRTSLAVARCCLRHGSPDGWSGVFHSDEGAPAYS